MMKSGLYSIGLLVLLTACGGGSGNEQVDDVQVADPAAEAAEQEGRRTYNRRRQYFIQGQQLYAANCANCHQAEGQGLGALYPPLKDSDYLPNHEAEIACGIKYGMRGPMTVNGVEYDQMMTPLGQLSNLEIAEIMTYVYSAFGGEERLIDVKTVDEYLAACEEQ